MKAFLGAVVVGAAISVGAWAILEDMGFSSAEQYTLTDVRLGD